MLEQGIWYFEEWELGVLGAEAKRRIKRGSTEGFVPRPIPQGEVKVTRCVDGDGDNEHDGLRIDVEVTVTHNTGNECEFGGVG